MSRQPSPPPRATSAAEGPLVSLNVKNDALTVSLDDYTHIYSFDSVGRMMTAFVDGRNYRRGLDNRFVVKVPTGSEAESGPSVRRTELTGTARDEFVSQLVSDVQRARTAFLADRAQLVGQRRTPDVDAEALSRWLNRIASWDAAEYRRESGRFLQVYKPITILPPDQYVSLVLQVAEGCSWNRCTFCDFYRDRGFHIKLGPELRQHIREVKQFAGHSMSWRKNIFLADANALVIPQPELVSILDVLNEEFTFVPEKLRATQRWEFQRNNEWSFEGLFSFMDVFGMRKKTADDFRELTDRHLKRVYIGLETGDDDLLAFLNKRGTAAQAVEAVRHIKQAGANVGVIIMAGVGGREWESRHVQRTIQVIRKMNLGAGDLVYLSPFVEHPTGEYVLKAREANLSAPTGSDVTRQLRTFKRELGGEAGGHKVSMYDIRDFIY